jgi:hypothetical protein
LQRRWRAEPIYAHSPEIAARQREWDNKKDRCLREASAAMERYRQTREDKERRAAISAIEHSASIENSEDRLFALLLVISGASPEIFWPTLLENWSGCDATWRCSTVLLRQMNSAGPAIPFFSPAQRHFFDSLTADVVRVFRGCSGSVAQARTPTRCPRSGRNASSRNVDRHFHFRI